MGSEVHRFAVLVTDVAAFQPPVEPVPVCAGADRAGAVDVGVGPGEQDRGPVGPPFPVAFPLPGDEFLQFFVDGDEGLAFHLPVVVAEIGGAVGVADDAAGGDGGGIGDPQPAADQDQGDQPVGRVVLPFQIRGVLDLGHDVPGKCPRKPLSGTGVVLGEDHGGRGQRGVPLVAADVAQERGYLPDVVPVRAPAGHRRGQVGEVALEQVPADVAGAGDASGGEESRYPGECPDAAVAGLRFQAGAQPPPRPPFGQVFQPWLADSGEPQGGAPGADAQAADVPGVAGVLVVPASALGEGGDLAVSVGQQCDRVPAPGGPGRACSPPVPLAAVEERGCPAAGQPADHGPHGGGLGLDHVVVAPALQGVLHFQAQPVGQRGQVCLFPLAGRLIAIADERARVRAALPLPLPVVGVAQGSPRVRPQLAVADPAGGLPGTGNDSRL